MILKIPGMTPPCSWPGCKATGNPYDDQNWCWYPRKYLWLPEGLCCPEHTAFIEAEKAKNPTQSFFRDWPLDRGPEVLALNEFMSGIVPFDSHEGQRIIREIEADANRATFQVIDGKGGG
jgi:hypothetical protein